MPGQGVLRGGDDQIERLDRRPGPANMDQPAALWPARLSLDPAGDGLVAAAGGDDQLGPGWLQRAGALPVDAQQRDAEEAIGQQLGRPIGEPLGRERPTQRLRQRKDLAVVAGLAAKQQPGEGRPQEAPTGSRRQMAASASSFSR